MYPTPARHIEKITEFIVSNGSYGKSWLMVSGLRCPLGPIVKNGTKYEKKEHIPAGDYSPVFFLSD